MAGKKVIITGVPGVGKTTVVNEALAKLKEEGIIYQSLNFGTFMFEIAQKEGYAKDRDEMRRLEKDVQKRLQQLAAKALAQIQGNVIIDTHASVKTPKGYLPGLPEWVLREIMPDILILVETDEDQILAGIAGRAAEAMHGRDAGRFVAPVVPPGVARGQAKAAASGARRRTSSGSVRCGRETNTVCTPRTRRPARPGQDRAVPPSPVPPDPRPQLGRSSRRPRPAGPASGPRLAGDATMPSA